MTADQLHQLRELIRRMRGDTVGVPGGQRRAGYELACRYWADQLEAALLAAPLTQPEGWQPIDAVQPEDGQECIVWRKWPGRRSIHVFERRQIGWTWQGLYGWEPTHWMPLPPAPLVTDH